MHANLGIGDEDLSMLAKEYEGVGLCRTEFFFIAREALPTEDDQYRLYRDLLESFAPKPLTIRTLDAGGDKNLPFYTIVCPVEMTSSGFISDRISSTFFFSKNRSCS